MKTVTLHDGREVSSDSEEWRHECEARAVLNMPLIARRGYLDGYTDERLGKYRRGVRDIRGESEAQRLRNTIMSLWIARKARQLAEMSDAKRAAQLRIIHEENGRGVHDKIVAQL